MSESTYQLVLDELENTKFPTCKTRKNISSDGVKAFVLGDVNYRGQKSLGGLTRGPSRYNKKFETLYDTLKEFIAKKKPNFKYTTIQVNKNVFCKPHVDKNNVGPSYVIALGDFTGGELVVEGNQFNIKNKFKKFDGRKAHWITPFKGTRYSIVFFTHTFKPPHPSVRNIRVTKKHIYNKDEEIIKSW
jgi:hypothetical protein